MLSSSSGVPLYEQIKSQIRGAVYAGELTPGVMLPSLRQLAADLRVSVLTVTRAYNDLVAERVLANAHGKGFTVLEVDSAQARAATSQGLADAVDTVVAAARAARATRADLDHLLDQKWSTT